MKPTILLINGPMAAGKSTVCRILDEKLPDFLFLDRAYVKDVMLKKISDRVLARQISKDAIHQMAIELMPLKFNLLFQEHRAHSVRKALGDNIEKYGYRVVSICLQCDVETAIKRDWKRHRKTRVHFVKEMHRLYGKPDTEDLIINTDKHRLEETVTMILHALKE